MSNYITRLKRELSNLKAERQVALMTDGFDINSPTVKALDREIRKLWDLIGETQDCNLSLVS